MVYIKPLSRDEDFSGMVISIGESASQQLHRNRYVEITVKLGGGKPKLYEGMTAQVTFITKKYRNCGCQIQLAFASREYGKSYVKKKEADGSIE